MANKVGRPIEYNDEIQSKAQGYIETSGENHIIKSRPVTINGVVNGEEEYVVKEIKLPTIEGLAVYLGISRDTVYDWEKKYKEFSYILDTLRAKQADMLINNGLSGDYNPTIAKVLLTKHGYREGIDQTTNDKDLPTPILGGVVSKKESE